MCSTSSPLRYTLDKKERLHLKRDVDALFASGQAFIAYPLRVIVDIRPIVEEEQAGCAILVVVAKKYFKRANKRNRVKRLIRECYRLNKHPLIHLAEERGVRVHIGLLSVAKELPSYHEVERGMLKARARIETLLMDEGKKDNEI